MWLRSNPRPAVAGTAVVALAVATAFAALWAGGGPAWAWWTVAVAAAAGGVIAAALVVTASLPRLERRGSRLRVRFR